jgi:hypothetical protein
MADKSLDAMLSAIELYNKPNFAYREESFAILAINAWELLFKARLLQLENNKLAVIIEYERRKKADGTRSEKIYRKKNRSGSHATLGLFQAVKRLSFRYGDKIPELVNENLILLCEVRDSAIHFMNKGTAITKTIQEVGTANVRNYVALFRQWFGVDLSTYNLFLMPLAFVDLSAEVDPVTLNSDEKKFVEFVEKAIRNAPAMAGDTYATALRMEVKFSRSKDVHASRVVVTNDPNAAQVTITEEDIRDKYPLDYGNLTAKLQNRYSNFLMNGEYHKIRRTLEKDERYCKERFLDPTKMTGAPKRFYNSNIIGEFDKHYKKKRVG